MINQDRIVPVTNTDLLSLYGLMLWQTNDQMVALDASEPGVFEAPAEYASDQVFFAAEPVKSFNVQSELPCILYFVPAYDYTGFTYNGAPMGIQEGSVDVVADGRTLYGALISNQRIGNVLFIKAGF